MNLTKLTKIIVLNSNIFYGQNKTILGYKIVAEVAELFFLNPLALRDSISLRPSHSRLLVLIFVSANVSFTTSLSSDEFNEEVGKKAQGGSLLLPASNPTRGERQKRGLGSRPEVLGSWRDWESNVQ